MTDRRAAAWWMAGVGLAILAGGCPVKETTPTDVGAASELQVLSRDHVLAFGDPPVTVIEYGDFQCPVCAMFAQQTFPTLKQNYVDTGKVRWVYRHLPLRQKHPQAQAAAEASECAARQDRFWDYADLLSADPFALTDADLRHYAEQLGLDLTAFDSCTSTHGQSARVEADVQSAASLGVTHTPTFFIGSKSVIGLLTVDEFSPLLDEALNSAGP